MTQPGDEPTIVDDRRQQGAEIEKMTVLKVIELTNDWFLRQKDSKKQSSSKEKLV